MRLFLVRLCAQTYNRTSIPAPSFWSLIPLFSKISILWSWILPRKYISKPAAQLSKHHVYVGLYPFFSDTLLILHFHGHQLRYPRNRFRHHSYSPWHRCHRRNTCITWPWAYFWLVQPRSWRQDLGSCNWGSWYREYGSISATKYAGARSDHQASGVVAAYYSWAWGRSTSRRGSWEDGLGQIIEDKENRIFAMMVAMFLCLHQLST